MNRSLRERFEQPRQVVRVDLSHRVAVHAGVATEREDVHLGVPPLEVVHEVDLGADRPGVTRVRVGDRLADPARRPGGVGRDDNLPAALGVDDHVRVVARSHRLDVADVEPLVDLAVAVPENDIRPRGVGRVRGVRAPGVPLRDGLGVDAEFRGGVAAEVFVGQEQHRIPAVERPLEGVGGVRRRADEATLLGTERLQIGVGVHVRDRDHLPIAGGVVDPLPGRVDLQRLRHPRHRTRRLHRREEDGLVVVGDDVGALGHERHPREHDVVRRGVRSALREFVGVADEVGVVDDLAALVVVAEDDHVVAQFLACGLDPCGALGLGEVPVRLRELFEVVVLEQAQVGLETGGF